MNLKKIGIVVAVLAFQTSYSQSSSINDSVNFFNSIKCEMIDYLEKIPVGQEFNFGFESREEFKMISFGKPYTLCSFMSTKTENQQYKFNKLSRWKVPLLVNNDYKCFLDVKKVDNKYKVVGIGLKYLAKDIETFEIKNKSCCNRKSCSLFIDYSTGIYCIAKENANTELEFYPIRPLNKCNIDKDKKYYKHEEFCTILKTKEKRKHDYIQK